MYIYINLYFLIYWIKAVLLKDRFYYFGLIIFTYTQINQNKGTILIDF